MCAVQSDPLTLLFADAAQPERKAVPALALAETLDGLQRLALLAGLRRDGKTPGRRVRPPRDVQRRYRLICELPEGGSYLQPVRLEGASLLSAQETADVMNTITDVLDAAGRGDEAAFDAALGDEVWRRYVLDAIERVAPARSSGVSLEVRLGDRVLCSGDAVHAFVERTSRQDQKKQGRAAVVGDLKKIDFLAHQMTLRHNVTGRELVCSYEPEVEASLLEHPREPILVFGLVTRDNEGRPQSIDAVDHIEPVDLTEISLTKVPLKEGAIEAREPLIASVRFNEDEVLYEASIEPLSINTFAETRDGLEAALQDELAAAWSIYTPEPDERLNQGAQLLKERLQEIFQNTSNAT